MIQFWDAIYFDKIRQIYKSNYNFSPEEQAEIEYEYKGAQYILLRNRKVHLRFIILYGLANSYLLVMALLIVSQVINEQNTVIYPIVGISLVIIGFAIFFIDIVIIYKFISVSNKFLGLLYTNND